MKSKHLSAKRLFICMEIGAFVSMLAVTLALYFCLNQPTVLIAGAVLIVCALFWLFILTQALGKRLSLFTSDICQTLDSMIDGSEAPKQSDDRKTLFARINHRLARLYEIMQEGRCKVNEERQELQALVSDISHQVKTPVSNLKMATDTLLAKPMPEDERTELISGIRNQTDKLDFLFQALVKTSRLETGVIQLIKKENRLYDTIAQALSGIAYSAEKSTLQ